jgi:hypothetical protein
MPYDEAQPDDPTMLVGVSVPGDEDSVREMAYAFAEEFAGMGFSRERILALFGSPRYAGAYGAGQRLGRQEIERIVEESITVFGAVRYVVRDCPPQQRFTIDPESGSVVTAPDEE